MSSRSKSRSLSEDERVLWRNVTRAIAPLKARQVEIEPAPAADPKTGKPAKRSMNVPLPTPSPASAPPPLAPLERRMRQRLARGVTAIDGRIDLHGLTQSDAHAALWRFLREAQAREAKLVLVITGKGGRADDPHGERGVLRRAVPLWLESMEFRRLVIGFESAASGHGGQGALYVRVRRGHRPAHPHDH